MAMIEFLYKPFDESHARAGAPYCNANGNATQVMKWDARGGCKLIGIQSNKLRDWASEWHPSQLVMLPLGYTDDEKPVWTGDLIIAPGKTAPRGAEPMQRIFSGYTWPVVAKEVEDVKRADAALCKTENLLETLGWRLKDGEWYNAYSRHFYGEIGGIHMTGEKADFKAVSDLCDMRDARPTREMAIAIAVEQFFINAKYTIPGDDAIDLAAIIASVKP